MPHAAPSLVLTDPTEAPRYPDGPLTRWCARALHDPRDEVFVRLTLKAGGCMAAGMVVLFLAWRTAFLPPLLVSAVYLAVGGWWLAPVILMLHNTMHRPFIRTPKWLGAAHPYVMSFLFGIPTGFSQHHVGMHHVEDNELDDLSSTMRYQRDSFLGFLHYFGRFLFLILAELTAYLVRKKRFRMARRAVAGEVGHWVVMAAACALDWRFGLVAFVFPTLAVRFAMMVGNWGQHAFLNTNRPNDGLSNAFTCINSGYNRRAFNDGYHIGHHLKQSRHWTEMPRDFEDQRAAYIAADAVVFSGIDSFLVSILLWTRQWKVLARHFVRLDGKPRSDEDVIAMLKARTRPVPVWPAQG